MRKGFIILKKTMILSIVFVAIILEIFSSCSIPIDCYEYRAHMDSIPYSETGYNPIKAITYKYLSNALGPDDHRLGVGTAKPININEINIYSEDSTVTNHEIKVFGLISDHKDKIFAFDCNEFVNAVGYNPSDRISISYDTADYAIHEKLNSLNKGDTVYIKGRLRLYYTRCNPHEGYYNCLYMVPGLFIDSSDDITLTPEPNETN